MNTLLHLLPGPNGLLVLLAPRAAREHMVDLAAYLACRGPARVLDGGNRFSGLAIAKTLAALLSVGKCGGLSLEEALRRIQVARAFTCYQIVTLLEQTCQAQADRASACAGPLPTLVVDLLDTFYDETVGLGERRRVLQGCLVRLRYLSEHAPVVISLRPPRLPQQDASGFVQLVQDAADHVWLQEEVIAPQPIRLF